MLRLDFRVALTCSRLCFCLALSSDTSSTCLAAILTQTDASWAFSLVDHLRTRVNVWDEGKKWNQKLFDPLTFPDGYSLQRLSFRPSNPFSTCTWSCCHRRFIGGSLTATATQFFHAFGTLLICITKWKVGEYIGGKFGLIQLSG